MTRNCPSASGKPDPLTSFFPEKRELFQGLTVYTHPPAPGSEACISLLDLGNLGEILAAGQDGINVARALLSPGEQDVFDHFTYPKRRVEWLGGRLAAKVSLFGLGHCSRPTGRFATVSILAADNGAPVLSCSLPGSAKPVLSISHSRQHAVGLTARAASCGIDIQQITDRTVRLVDRFAEPAEQELLRHNLPDMDEATRLTLLWAAKEAMKKSLLADQPVIFQGVCLQSVTAGELLALRLGYQGKKVLQAHITALRLGDSILAFTLAGGDNA